MIFISTAFTLVILHFVHILHDAVNCAQESLAEEMSSLVHCFQQPDTAFQFISAFFKTEAREWFGIDRLRLDKFMTRFVCWFNLICYCLKLMFTYSLLEQGTFAGINIGLIWVIPRHLWRQFHCVSNKWSIMPKMLFYRTQKIEPELQLS